MNLSLSAFLHYPVAAQNNFHPNQCVISISTSTSTGINLIQALMDVNNYMLLAVTGLTSGKKNTFQGQQLSVKLKKKE